MRYGVQIEMNHPAEAELLSPGSGSITVPFANQVEDWKSDQDEYSSDERAFEIAGVAPYKYGGSAHHEDGREHWVSPNSVGPREVWPTSAVNKNGGSRQHVKQPLRKYREFKMLLKLGKEEQQHGREQALHQ